MLKLPADVRLQIFEYLFGGLHADVKYVRHWPSKKKEWKSHGVTYKNPLIPSRLTYRGEVIETNYWFSFWTPQLRTCRSIYKETSLLSYALTVFSFDSWLVMSKWMLSLYLPQRRAVAKMILRFLCPRPRKVCLKYLKELRERYLREFLRHQATWSRERGRSRYRATKQKALKLIITRFGATHRLEGSHVVLQISLLGKEYSGFGERFSLFGAFNAEPHWRIYSRRIKSSKENPIMDW